MKLSFRSLVSFAFTLITYIANAQYIAVDTEQYSQEELVKNIFFGNQSTTCINVENIKISGHDFGSGNISFGYFNKNGSSFELEEGIILSTGSASEATGPNSNLQSYSDTAWAGDQDLENALNINKSYNATILEFDFIANNTNRISFDYLFSSEQYLRSGDSGSCDFTDGFVFLIKEAGSTDYYRNLAVIPNTTTPIKSNSVRGGGEKCPAINEEYFGHYNYNNSPTNFNGQTKVLTASSEIVPGIKYHLKIVIADQGNGLYDSGVFLKAGSFVGSKYIGEDRLRTNGSALCEGSTLTLDATATAGATYQWYKNDITLIGESNPTLKIIEDGTYKVLINDSGCNLQGSIKIEYIEKAKISEKSFCNYNDGNLLNINLHNLDNEIVENILPYTIIKYYLNQADAIAGNSNTINTLQYKDDTTIFIRVENGSCAAQIVPIHFNVPKRSLTLKDQTICNNAKTTLKVEETFKYYKWFDSKDEVIAEGASANQVSVSVGRYTIELTSQNGCTLKQTVNISAATIPEITNIVVSGSSAAISVVGGTPPYLYSLDNTKFQASNTFSNVPRGLRTVFVKDSNNCEVIKKEFLIVNLLNIITPNGDGKNDVLDYSDLYIKKDVKIAVYDRFGSQIFLSDKQPYIWDGTSNGRPIATGNYWYVLNWIEPDTGLAVTYNGWILLKDRN